MAKAHGSPEIGTGAGEGLVRRHPDLTEAARDWQRRPRPSMRFGGRANAIYTDTPKAARWSRNRMAAKGTPNTIPGRSPTIINASA